MLPWEKRPVEVANLFNPAFCSLLLREAIIDYQKEKNQGMPYALAFLILPVILHKPTREALPRSIVTKLFVWLQNHPEVRVEFAEHTRKLLPYTKEALIFGMREWIIDVNDEGNLIPYERKLGIALWEQGSEPYVCIQKAQLLGRLLALSGEVQTIFTIWGIQP